MKYVKILTWNYEDNCYLDTFCMSHNCNKGFLIYKRIIDYWSREMFRDYLVHGLNFSEWVSILTAGHVADWDQNPCMSSLPMVSLVSSCLPEHFYIGELFNLHLKLHIEFISHCFHPSNCNLLCFYSIPIVSYIRISHQHI